MGLKLQLVSYLTVLTLCLRNIHVYCYKVFNELCESLANSEKLKKLTAELNVAFETKISNNGKH